jgi:hypothetical protein
MAKHETLNAAAVKVLTSLTTCHVLYWSKNITLARKEILRIEIPSRLLGALYYKSREAMKPFKSV